MTLRRIVLLIMALTLALLLSACGGGGEEPQASEKKAVQPAPPVASPENVAQNAPAAPAAPANEEDQAIADYKIKDSSNKEILRVKHMRAGRWTVREGDQKWALEADGSNVWKWILPTGTKLKAEKKDDKLKLKDDQGAVLVEVKFYDDKFKINFEGSGEYQFKYKDEKVKVYLDDSELGQVKYYADTGKVKAKDAVGNEIAEVKDLKRVSAAPAPFLMRGSTPRDVRYFLIALFFTLEK